MTNLEPLRLLLYLTTNTVVPVGMLVEAGDLASRGLIDFDPTLATAVVTATGQKLLHTFGDMLDGKAEE